MRFFQVVSWAAAASAIVIPDRLAIFDDVRDAVESDEVNPLDAALNAAIDCEATAEEWLYNLPEQQIQLADPDTWAIDDEDSEFYQGTDDEDEDVEEFAPWLESPESASTGHGGEFDLTVYEMIAKSKYTTKLAKLVADDDELVDILNNTDAKLTLFAPTDKAFEKLERHGKHHKKPSKELIRRVLLNHISDDYYPARRVLRSYTIPTRYKEKALGGLQRLTVKTGLRGLTINWFSRVVAKDIIGNNGVVHAVDNLVLITPPTLPAVVAFPGAFSTLALGLAKTGLLEELADTPHTGGTVFAPLNSAFQKLGWKINAFLYSRWGTKYLKALLKYHVVHNATLYSDAFYHDKDSEDAESTGYWHLDLPTLLEGRSIPVDIKSWGPFKSITVNGYGRVVYSDSPQKDGVVQVVNHVLIPPHKHHDHDGDEDAEAWNGGEMELEEFKARMSPYIEDEIEDEVEDEDTADDLFDLFHMPHHADTLPSDWSKYYL